MLRTAKWKLPGDADPSFTPLVPRPGRPAGRGAWPPGQRLHVGGQTTATATRSPAAVGPGRPLGRWHGQNRLTQCGHNGTTTTHTYGSDGLRRRTVQGSTTTNFVLDGDAVVRTLINAGETGGIASSR
jgi:hypothetical protein